MERKKFLKGCCYLAIGMPLMSTILPACGSIYYASFQQKNNQIVIAKSEFFRVKNNKESYRTFILIKIAQSQFPICIYRIDEDKYVGSLLKCTHRSCELNVGGGIYTCPCHGSEFSMEGKLLQGPAEKDLLTFKTETDESYIYVLLS